MTSEGSVLLLREYDRLLLLSLRLWTGQAIDQLTELLAGDVVEGAQPVVLLLRTAAVANSLCCS